jgi:hypothetical protein
LLASDIHLLLMLIGLRLQLKGERLLPPLRRVPCLLQPLLKPLHVASQLHYLRL